MGADGVRELREAAVFSGAVEERQLGAGRGAVVDLPELAGEEAASVIALLGDEGVLGINRSHRAGVRVLVE